MKTSQKPSGEVLESIIIFEYMFNPFHDHTENPIWAKSIYSCIENQRGMIEYISEIIGVTSIVVAIIIGVFFYLRGRRVKKLSFGMRRINILTKEREIPNLRISFGNELVERLFLTRVAIYNDGNQVIDASDIAKKDPLRIVIPEGFRIFDAGFFFIRNEANDFSLKVNKEEGVIWLTFDYMNEGEGCVVEIFDDIDRFHDISVIGSIKGIKEIQEKVLAGSDLRMYLDFAYFFLSFLVVLWLFNTFSFSILLMMLHSAVLSSVFLLDEFLKRKLPICNAEFYLEKVYFGELSARNT